MARYKKRPDGRYATTIMFGYKPDGKPNNIFLSAKTEKELREKIAETKMKIKADEIVKESDMLLKDYADVLFNQAMLIQGLPIEDPAAYARKIAELLVKA